METAILGVYNETNNTVNIKVNIKFSLRYSFAHRHDAHAVDWW